LYHQRFYSACSIPIRKDSIYTEKTPILIDSLVSLLHIT